MTKYIDPTDENITARRTGRIEDAEVEGHRYHSFTDDEAVGSDTEGHGRNRGWVGDADDASTSQAPGRRTLFEDAGDDTEGHGRRKL